MNYSIMSEEDLAEEITSERLNNRCEFEVEGKLMEIDLNSGELLRVISSNPKDYLLYQPGLQVAFEPQIH